jgi:hypothetical protein
MNLMAHYFEIDMIKILLLYCCIGSVFHLQCTGKHLQQYDDIGQDALLLAQKAASTGHKKKLYVKKKFAVTIARALKKIKKEYPELECFHARPHRVIITFDGKQTMESVLTLCVHFLSTFTLRNQCKRIIDGVMHPAIQTQSALKILNDQGRIKIGELPIIEDGFDIALTREHDQWHFFFFQYKNLQSSRDFQVRCYKVNYDIKQKEVGVLTSPNN